jgi:S-adenosylmethionine-dependent methyltransferase
LEIARRRLVSPPIEDIVETDARDLSRWRDAAIDAALVLGPLYHLPDEADRERVVSEVRRVVRPGGTVFFALMPVFAFMRRTAAIPDERRRFADDAFVRGLLDTGEFMNDVPGRFTHGWGTKPQDAAPWFERCGLETLALAASEGIAAWMEAAFVELRSTDAAAFDAAMKLIIETATEPSLLGSAKHLLYVARRP